MVLIEKDKHIPLFQARLASLNTDGLKDPDLRAEYLVQYKGSLIGKHFKSVAQVMPFLISDLVPKLVLDAWTIIGRLVVLLWHTRIEEIEVYLADLSRTIEDFLNITAQCSPSILILKPKFHFLVHLPLYIRRFGPALLYSTDRYESFNHVFRLTNIYSNRQAPSRDTCNIFATQDRIKHVVTGGFWLDKDLKKWVCAGPAVVEFFKENPIQAALMGLKLTLTKETGNFEL